MIAEMKEALQPHLSAILGRDAGLSEPVLLAGGASKEAWAVDAGGEPLLVRRAGGGVIHRHTLSLADEFAVIEAAYEAGVKVPRPIRYIADLDGREAVVMERIHGETIGRRIVRMDPVPPRLPLQLAEQLAKIHAIPPERLPFLAETSMERLVEELDETGEPHPAIELGLWWLRENKPSAREPVVVHGDFRIGNVAVDANGLVGVLDWEFAHLDDPARDLAFGLVRAWRFGRDDLRLRFRMLVALNALGILRRELAALPEEDDTETRELALRIRAGDVPPGTLARVKAGVAAKLLIDSPRYLDRYDTGTPPG